MLVNGKVYSISTYDDFFADGVTWWFSVLMLQNLKEEDDGSIELAAFIHPGDQSTRKVSIIRKLSKVHQSNRSYSFRRGCSTTFDKNVKYSSSSTALEFF